jgi:hypothetical protein
MENWSGVDFERNEPAELTTPSEGCAEVCGNQIQRRESAMTSDAIQQPRIVLPEDLLHAQQTVT